MAIQCAHHTRPGGRFTRCPNEATAVVPRATRPARCAAHVFDNQWRPLTAQERRQGFVNRGERL